MTSDGQTTSILSWKETHKKIGPHRTDLWKAEVQPTAVLSPKLASWFEMHLEEKNSIIHIEYLSKNADKKIQLRPNKKNYFEVEE